MTNLRSRPLVKRGPIAGCGAGCDIISRYIQGSDPSAMSSTVYTDRLDGNTPLL